MRQDELAETAGVAASYISMIETGKRTKVGGPTLSRIARVLNTTTDYLLGLTDDPRPRQGETREKEPAIAPELWPLIEMLNKQESEDRSQWVEIFTDILKINEELEEQEFEELPPDVQEFIRLFDLLPDDLKDQFRRELEEAVARQERRAASA